MTTLGDFSGGTIDKLLLDAGHTDVPELRAALFSLASLAQLPAPVPGPELAAMLAGPQDELTRQRWLRRHRPAVVGIAVLAGMGLGVSGVAATSPVPEKGSGLWSVQQLTNGWTPGWSIPVPSVLTAVERPGRWTSPLYLQLFQDGGTQAGNAKEPAPQSAVAEEARQPAPPVRVSAGKPPVLGNQSRVSGPTSNKGASGRTAAAREAARQEIGKDNAADPAGEGASGIDETATIGLQEPGAEEPGKASIPLEPVTSWLGKFRR